MFGIELKACIIASTMNLACISWSYEADGIKIRSVYDNVPEFVDSLISSVNDTLYFVGKLAPPSENEF